MMAHQIQSENENLKGLHDWSTGADWSNLRGGGRGCSITGQLTQQKNLLAKRTHLYLPKT